MPTDRRASSLRAGVLSASTALRGRVVAMRGGVIEAVLPDVSVGGVYEVERTAGSLLAEVVGFDDERAHLLPYSEPRDVAPGSSLRASQIASVAPCAVSARGRVLDALGRDLQTGESLPASSHPVRNTPPNPLLRRPVDEQVVTGVRVLDGLLPLGRGQRVGLFAGSGVGKSTLLAQLARGIDADAVVIALVGERGREVGEFVHEHLDARLRERTTLVVATGDAPPMLRRRAAECATALAEQWRDEGKHALLLTDSLTRYARALREAALLAGEPPARRGYPASVFAELPRLLERSGQSARGSITAIYTVLVEGSNMEEPIADEVRGIVDGHWVLSRDIAQRGRFPALDILQSVSRTAASVTARDILADAASVRAVMERFESRRDAIELGLYTRGTDARLDIAIDAQEEIEAFLRQSPTDYADLDATLAELNAMAAVADWEDVG